MDLQPFSIQISRDTLDDLRRRLSDTRWPDVENADSSTGIPIVYMQSLTKYWQSDFDWREQERELNSFPQFVADVDGHQIHFIHQRGNGSNPLPIIMTHGWPGSFSEFTKIIPLLTDPVNHGGDAIDSFDVVIPSMPGYGFSDKPRESGMNAFRIAELWIDLMDGLGYRRFAAQGGDWGASVSTCIALTRADRLIGLHLNYIPGSYKPWLGDGSRKLSSTELEFQGIQEQWYESDGAYAHLQRTKPLTPAYGLNDSPVGLAAWIVEKFRDWSDCDGDVESRFSKNELLTNVMLYWATGTIHSSMKLYEEATRRPIHFGASDRVAVPCAIARFAKEAPFPPREWVERGYNVQRWKEFAKGGHFAAMEEPELLANDISSFFREMR